MEHQPRLVSAAQIATTKAGLIVAVIADLSRTVSMLERHVAAEEERSRICDPYNAEYPMLARTTAARIENLRATIAALQARLASTQITGQIAQSFAGFGETPHHAGLRRGTA
jgi:hypothetical protein